MTFNVIFFVIQLILALGVVVRLERGADQSAPGAGGGAAPRPEATDATGALRVMLDAQGRVVNVEMDQRWRSRLTPDELTTALFDTYYAARAQAAETGQQPEVSDDAGGDERLRPLGPGVDHAERWRRINEIRTRYQAARERRAQFSANAREPSAHVGPNGYLTATMQWGAVIRISGDPHQLQYADTDKVQQDAFALLSLPNQSLTE